LAQAEMAVLQQQMALLEATPFLAPLLQRAADMARFLRAVMAEQMVATAALAAVVAAHH